MCEPAHSIVQYPDKDPDDNLPFGGQMDMDQRLKATLGEKIVAWGRRIRNWFHFSKLGNGHTGAIKLTGQASLILPPYTSYEGLWWDRKFILDGRYHGPIVDREEAIRCASQYHNQVALANMSTFRRFLETSIMKSDRAEGYVTRFLENVLTKEGRDKVNRKLHQVFGKTITVGKLFGNIPRNDPQRKVRATKALMGYTRKRNLFLPHWADDNGLWTG